MLNHSNAFRRRFTVISCGVVQGEAFNEILSHNLRDPMKISLLHQYLMEREVNANEF